MSIKHILWHPDPHLKKTCATIEMVDNSIRKLADDMLETMYDAPGVGLAAPQVGQIKRLFVMDCSAKEDEDQPMVLINPAIVWSSEEESTYNEGCLSLPEMFEDVTRPAEVVVQYLDKSGAEQEKHFKELWATCAQHEIDHLDGILFIDHISKLKRSMITKKMIKAKKERDQDG
ncbi:MAG: peptide deformylase [Rhodobacteraceae bacterium]|nr:peptide deformylase [Paracoccaceae bacterium]